MMNNNYNDNSTPSSYCVHPLLGQKTETSDRRPSSHLVGAMAALPPRGTLYHLVPEAEWLASAKQAKPYFPATYEQDGFTHLSDTPSVLLSIGNAFYKSIEGAFIVLALGELLLEGDVRYEAAAPVGNTKADFDGSDERKFPHLYGPIHPRAVVQQLRVVRDDEGRFVSLEG